MDYHSSSSIGIKLESTPIPTYKQHTSRTHSNFQALQLFG